MSISSLIPRFALAFLCLWVPPALRAQQPAEQKTELNKSLAGIDWRKIEKEVVADPKFQQSVLTLFDILDSESQQKVTKSMNAMKAGKPLIPTSTAVDAIIVKEIIFSLRPFVHHPKALAELDILSTSGDLTALARVLDGQARPLTDIEQGILTYGGRYETEFGTIYDVRLDPLTGRGPVDRRDSRGYASKGEAFLLPDGKEIDIKAGLARGETIHGIVVAQKGGSYHWFPDGDKKTKPIRLTRLK